MIDLSNNKLSYDNIDNIYNQIDESSDKEINTIWLGMQDYKPVFDLQKKIHSNRTDKMIKDVILMLEHEHVYTLGKNANLDHVLSDSGEIVQADRGGDVTYHGPGQLVCYPILDLNKYNKSITWYVSILQDTILSILSEYDIKAIKKDSPYTGIWVDDEKIAAIGIRLSKWISMHGFSVNVNTNLSYYDNIIPCGIFEYGVTSINALTNKKIDMLRFANKIDAALYQKLTNKVES